MEGNEQRIEVITFQADTLQTITMKLPAGEKFHNVTTGKTILKENGQPETEIIEHIIPRFKVATVFDVSQTDGEPLPDLGGGKI